MKCTDKKFFDTGKGKNKKNQLYSNSYFCKILISIRKFRRLFSLNPTVRSIIKNTVVFTCSFILTCFIYLLVQTRSPLSDVFTNDRISVLKDRPANITRDIVIDMYFMPDNGGMITLTRSLIVGIARKRPNWRLLVLISEDCASAFDLPRRDNIKLIKIRATINPLVLAERIFNSPRLGLLHDKFLQLLCYNRIFYDKYCDLVWDPLGDSSFCNFVTIPRISTIHDLACFDIDPKFYAMGDYRMKSSMCTENSVCFSKKIVTVSEFSKKRICEHFNVSKDFVKHIPIQLGTRIYSNSTHEESAAVLNKYKLKPKKYFIFCSTWWRHKNQIALMKAFNKFAQKNLEMKLILVGKYRGSIETSSIKDFCSDRLIITGFVPDKDLGILLKNALAFIHPSVYEGFGMPIIEAMINGIPVACSNVASLPEVAGSAALFFDPFDTDSITQAMHHMADDPQLRKDLIQKGYEQAKKYSDRDAMVDEYIRVMEEVMHENDLKKATMKK